MADIAEYTPPGAADFHAPEPPAPVASPDDEIGPMFGSTKEPELDTTGSPEAAKSREVTPEGQMIDMKNITLAAENDVSRVVGALDLDQRKALTTGSDEDKSKAALYSAHRLREGKIPPKGLVNLEASARPLVLYKDGKALTVKSVHSVKDKADYNCTVIGEDGTSTVEVSATRDEIANAQLLSEKATILTAITDPAQHKVMELYIDSLKSDDPTAVLEGKTPEELHEINAAIAETAESRILPTTKDGDRFIATLRDAQLLHTKEKFQKEKGLDEEGLVKDKEYNDDVNAILDRARAREVMITGAQPGNLLTAEGMSALITDMSGVSPATIEAALDGSRQPLLIRLREQKERQNALNSSTGDDVESKQRRELLKNQLAQDDDEIMKMRVDIETLETIKFALTEGGLQTTLEGYINGAASPEDRKALKDAFNSENPEDIMTIVLKNDEANIRETIQDKDKQEAALAENAAKHERRVRMAKRMGVGFGFAGIAIALMVMTSFKGGGGGGGGH